MDPTLKCALLVRSEIDAGMLLEGEEDAAQIVKIDFFDRFGFCTVALRLFDVRMVGDSLKLGGNLFR